jgi:hypothetical protein
VQQPQADSELEEQHLINFVVNRLEDTLPLDLGKDVDVTLAELYKVLVGACADGTSITHICETTDDSPHHNTVREYLTDQFDLETLEFAGNTLLQRELIEILPNRPVEVVADLHLDPYYGNEDETAHLYSSEAKRGTTTFPFVFS